MSVNESGVLVERFQDGETSVFDELVGRCHHHVYRLAYHFTHNYEDAYDISQEVFLKVFKSLGNLKNSSTFDAWLRRVTVNACIDHLRQRPDEQTLGDFFYLSYGHAAGELPNRPVEMAELRNVISAAVDRLPKRQREAFILRHYEDLSLNEIARTLDCSVGAVKAHLFHATRKLRKSLSHYIL
jgi:RNA polymerase sigma-70 factor (ECF subfamily)